MTEAEAHKILSASSPLSPGKFYGSTEQLALGTGLIYAAIRCPVYNPEDRLFSTMELPVYVLTHECDVDQDNDRSFNEYLTVCPLILLSEFLIVYEEWMQGADNLGNFLSAIANRSVNRLMYLPPGPGQLQYGALLYLNNIVSTHICEFESVKPFASVSAYGLEAIDKTFFNHFLRPKADRLSLGPKTP